MELVTTRKFQVLTTGSKSF